MAVPVSAIKEIDDLVCKTVRVVVSPALLELLLATTNVSIPGGAYLKMEWLEQTVKLLSSHSESNKLHDGLVRISVKINAILTLNLSNQDELIDFLLKVYPFQVLGKGQHDASSGKKHISVDTVDTDNEQFVNRSVVLDQNSKYITELKQVWWVVPIIAFYIFDDPHPYKKEHQPK